MLQTVVTKIVKALDQMAQNDPKRADEINASITRLHNIGKRNGSSRVRKAARQLDALFNKTK